MSNSDSAAAGTLARQTTFDVEAWEGEDRVITMNGKPVGQSINVRDAAVIKRWLPTAIRELRAEPTPPSTGRPSLVAGDHMDRSLADFVRSCEVHLAEEQVKPNPDNALIALLCDAVRLAREQKPRLLDAKDQDHRDERGELQNVPSVQAAAAQVDLALHGLPSKKIAPPVSGEGTGTLTRLRIVSERLALVKFGCQFCVMTVDNGGVPRHEADCLLQRLNEGIIEAESTLADLRRQGEWQPMDTAPVEGPFLITDGRRCMVADGHMYSLSVLPETPRHLSGHHWTHWRPLPDPPKETL